MVPLSGTPRRVLYPGPLRMPTGTLHEVIGEVELVPTSPGGLGSASWAERLRLRIPEGFWIGRNQVHLKRLVFSKFVGRALGWSDPEGVSPMFSGGLISDTIQRQDPGEKRTPERETISD